MLASLIHIVIHHISHLCRGGEGSRVHRMEHRSVVLLERVPGMMTL